MQYEVNSPQEYLEALDHDWRREKLLQIREWILTSDSPPDEFIQYKMLAYGHEDRVVFHLNAQKNYVSLYTGNVDKVKNGQKLLETFDIGKGCIRIKKSQNIEESELPKFIENAIDQWNKSEDLDC